MTNVPASSLRVRPGGQDRTEFNEAELASLAASIEAQGCLQRPGVRAVEDGYEIVFGERRIRAMRDVLGWDDIPVDILELTDEQAAWGMLVENVMRADLDPISEARAHQDRIDRLGATPARIAAECGVQPARVRDRLKLLALTEHVAHWVACRQLPICYATLMVALDANRQAIALRAFQEHLPAIDAFGALCARLLDEQAADEAEGMFDADSFLRLDEYVLAAQELVRAEAAPTVVRELVLGIDEIMKLYGISRATVRGEGFPSSDLWVSGRSAWYQSTVDTWAADAGAVEVQPLALEDIS